MSDLPPTERRLWADKFRDAFRGLKDGVRGQSSFFAHFFAAVAAIGVGLTLRVTRLEWCLLVLCIAGVLAAEMFNTAIEVLARSVNDQDDPNLRQALDISAAAVLLSAAGSVVVGLILFVPPFAKLLGLW